MCHRHALQKENERLFVGSIIPSKRYCQTNVFLFANRAQKFCPIFNLVVTTCHKNRKQLFFNMFCSLHVNFWGMVLANKRKIEIGLLCFYYVHSFLSFLWKTNIWMDSPLHQIVNGFWWELSRKLNKWWTKMVKYFQNHVVYLKPSVVSIHQRILWLFENKPHHFLCFSHFFFFIFRKFITICLEVTGNYHKQR